MTVAAQPQFSTSFSHDFSGSIAGTFGALSGATPGTAPRGKRLGGRSAASLPSKLAGKLTGNWPFRPAPQDHVPNHVPAGRGADGSRTRPVPEDAGRAAPVGKTVKPGVVGEKGGEVSVREMVTDVLLVGMWAAMIPGMMWLGSALGF
ncbi:hypothetical protein [Bordetella sp. LUAb4]|uniref:hypothetical protein n=1 Tax=Bordetella sp. LUAb4 TaxID=2843195 RepID=UPI001E471853|nr:hypothetical protein [Bordetella sp. LUAb4]